MGIYWDLWGISPFKGLLGGLNSYGTIPRVPPCFLWNTEEPTYRAATNHVDKAVGVRWRSLIAVQVKYLWKLICIFIYIYVDLYLHTYNPNDPCFAWKRPWLLRGRPSKIEVSWGSRYIYIHWKSKDQTLPIGSKEFFTWIIPKTILRLVGWTFQVYMGGPPKIGGVYPQNGWWK